MRNKKIGLVWLHNELRLHDNAVFTSASKQCKELVIAYASFDFPANRGQSYHYNGMSENRQRFLNESLSDLANSLQSLGNQLLFLPNVSLSQWLNFIQTHGITDIYHSQSADYDHNKRLQNVAELLPEITFHELSTVTFFVTLPSLSLPKNFTPFREQIEKNHHLLRQTAPIAQSEIPSRLPQMPSDADKSLIYQSPLPTPKMGEFIGGETQALCHLEHYFTSNAPSVYKETRNALDDWENSTKFSAWLANGSLSVRTLLMRLREYEKTSVKNESTYWIWFELLWREYYYWHAQVHEKKIFTLKGVSPCKLKSCFYGERYERWKHGNMPYPIVNACMNQLRETGFMSNRGRQIVASCFVHELGMDWRYGATYFEQQLIDYDVHSNWANWQYIAGVGADPRGGRQFNLAKQTKLYDPNGEFIAKWNGDVGTTQIDSVDAADWPIV